MDVQTSNLKWSNAQHTAIDMMCKFPNMSEFVPFTASPNDPETYGRELFSLASTGHLGPISPYNA